MSGRRIRTDIDGVPINDTEDKLPVLEPLYYSSSVEDSTGDIIVKVVNMQEESVTAEVILEEFGKESVSADVFELSGYAPDDENSFESPVRVSPKQKSLTAESGGFICDFPKQSMTVFKMRH